MSPMPCVLLDVDCNLDRAWLGDLAETLTTVSLRDFAHAEPFGYGVGAQVRVAQNAGDVGPGDWTIAFLSHPDVAGALGYHDRTPNGRPLAKCFPFLDDEAMRSVTASHELFEMLADAELSNCVVGPDGVIRCREPGDPVETTHYDFTCLSGRVLRVSNFVTPAYFAGVPDGSVPFDFLGLLREPGQILPGGYQIVWDPAAKQWTQVTNGTKRAYRQAVGATGHTRMAMRAARGVTP